MVLEGTAEEYTAQYILTSSPARHLVVRLCLQYRIFTSVVYNEMIDHSSWSVEEEKAPFSAHPREILG